MEKMDHLMAEKLMKIINTAKRGKSHQKIFLKKNKKQKSFALNLIF